MGHMIPNVNKGFILMEIEVILTSLIDLEKTQIMNVGTIINRVFGKSVIGGKGRKVCSISRDGDGTHYTFTFESENTEDTCDILANELYNKLDFDFEVQIECDIDEDYLEPCDNDDSIMLIDDDTSVEHSKWVSECVSNGWSYGMEYSKKDKKSPFLKPYHALSESQKEVLIKSKDRHGKVCVDEDIMAECFNGVK